MENQILKLVSQEQAIIDAFRGMSEECQQEALFTMQAWAKAFPRRRPVSLSLVAVNLTRDTRRKGAG
jgi:hypothetical protein